MDISSLDRGTPGEAFTFTYTGENHRLPAARDIPAVDLAAACDDVTHFGLVLTPTLVMSRALLEVLAREYRAFYDLPAGNAHRLLANLERYGDQIEADLAQRGWDLQQMFAGRRWRFLLNQIDHLPRTSHYQEARAQDDELAEGMLEHLSDGPPAPPALTEFSPEVEVLQGVLDRLGEVVNAVVASGGGKPSPVRPGPRPVTALDRARARRLKDASAELEAKLFPRTP